METLEIKQTKASPFKKNQKKVGRKKKDCVFQKKNMRKK